MVLSEEWAHFHTAFISGPLAVNFFREERYAACAGMDFDIVPFGSEKLVIDRISPNTERYNTGGAGAAITVRIGIFDGGSHVWCDESTGDLLVEPFAETTSAVQAVWRGLGGQEVRMHLFPGSYGSVLSDIQSKGVEYLLVEISQPEFHVPGFTCYAADYSPAEGLLRIDQPEYQYHLDARLTPATDVFQIGLVGALTGKNIDPVVQWYRDKCLEGQTDAGWESFAHKQDENDRSTLHLSGGGLVDESRRRSPLAFRSWFILPGGDAGLSIQGAFMNEPVVEADVRTESRKYLAEWHDRNVRISATEASGIDSVWSKEQIARLMSAHAAHPLHPERLGSTVAGSCYWEWLNFRDSAQIALTLTALGLIGEARGIYETWWGHHVEGGKPLHRNIAYNRIIDAMCTEIPGVRMISLYRHVLMTGDLSWAGERAVPLALWLGNALLERIDPEKGFVLGGSQEQDMDVGKPGFDLVVQATTFGGFEALGHLLDLVDDQQSAVWLERAETLRKSVEENFPTLENGGMTARVEADGMVASFDDIFGHTFPILLNLLPFDHPCIRASENGIRSLAASPSGGAPYWGRRGTTDPRASDFGRTWFMMVHQGEPVGTAWMKLNKRKEAEEVLQLHIDSVARDTYKCAVEEEQLLPASLREDTPSERAAREYVRSFIWGPFPWVTSNPLYMLNVEGFCLLTDESGNTLFLHANPVLAPYRRTGKVEAEFDGYTVRMGNSIVAEMDAPGDIDINWALCAAHARAYDKPLNISIRAPGLRGLADPLSGVECREDILVVHVQPYDRIWIRWTT